MSANLEQRFDLTRSEVEGLTGFRQPRRQIEFLKEAGIPARLRGDNSVLVLRLHLLYPVAPAATLAAPGPGAPAPRLRLIGQKRR